MTRRPRPLSASRTPQDLSAARARLAQQGLRDAQAPVTTASVGRPRRAGIPNDVKKYVWQRDGGRCVECDSNENLEYDHIIPVSMGGATSVENLQLLCAPCNRAKGGTLG